MEATKAGMILGTAAYSTPEREGRKSVDKQANFWAFGVVGDEMLTVAQLFKGDDFAGILASMVKDEPGWSRVAAEVRRMLGSCLEKDSRRTASFTNSRILPPQADNSA